jgi:hypothetical protein
MDIGSAGSIYEMRGYLMAPQWLGLAKFPAGEARKSLGGYHTNFSSVKPPSKITDAEKVNFSTKDHLVQVSKDVD